MKISENENVLKGQKILARGKRRRSVAPGWRASKRIVRAIKLSKEHFFSRTDFVVRHIPGATFLIVPPFPITSGPRAIAILPFQGDDVHSKEIPGYNMSRIKVKYRKPNRYPVFFISL